ncbi:MAG: O-antigen polymerase, partial [Bacteroidota bacterium]|nr:O-antigen polymerase [Bacteroidota bacterium]
MALKKINKNFFISVILLFLINIAFELYYNFFITKAYFTEGYILDINFFKYLESKIWLILIIGISFILNSRSQFISSIYLFLIILIFIPSHIIYSYSNGSSLVFYSVVTFFIIISLFSTIKLKIKTISLNKTYKYYLFLIFTILLLIPIIKDFKFEINLNVLKLNNIYDVREVYKSNISFLSSYTFGWLAKVVIPIMLVYSLIRKNYKVALLSFFVLLYLFLISGHKSVYFTPIVILFYYFMGKDYNKKIMLTFLFLLIFFILINIPDILMDRYLFKSLFIRRMFFVSPLLNEYYFDFFQGQPVYLSHSIFKLFIDYPYDVTPAYIIGDVYFNKPNMSANNGIISDGFMNFGYLGVIIFSFLFSIILAILNSIKLNAKYFGIFI